MDNTQPSDLVSKRKVIRFFAAAYFAPLLIYTLGSVVLGGLFSGLVASFMAFYFPSGLAGLWLSRAAMTANEDILRWTAFGYVVYALLLTLMLLFRKSWQFTTLSIILLMLLVVNFAGCKIVAAQVGSHISAP